MGFSVFGGLGALLTSVAVWKVASFISIYLRPSKLNRYLHRKDGKHPWALVTGSTIGIGTQYAHQLASRGFNIILHGRNPEKVKRVLEELQTLYPERSFRTWIADGVEYGSGQTSMDEIVQLAEDLNLTVLVNNAGGQPRPFTTLDKLPTDSILEGALVNALFPTLLTAALLPILSRSAPSLVINVTSAADTAIPLLGAYPGSKSYMVTLTTMLRREAMIEKHNIEFLCIKYGVVKATGAHPEPPTFFEPSAAVAVKASLDRVGCGRDVVTAYLPHALQLGLLGSLPLFIQDRSLIEEMKKWR
jgi:17beta-estradiol 17-dehydrogenase / very-long-chain 3-oxoacyl-CoA reductase